MSKLVSIFGTRQVGSDPMHESFQLVLYSTLIIVRGRPLLPASVPV